MMENIGYVTFDPATGALLGSFFQVPPEAHADRIEVDEATRANWCAYRANEARDGVELAPPAPVDLDAARAQRWEAIKAERDRIKRGGVRVDGYWFHSDDSSRIQQIGLVLMGVNVPPVQWKTMSGALVPMTQTLANQIFAAVATLDQNAFANAEVHRVAMEASANPANYDFTTGWPEIYAGA